MVSIIMPVYNGEVYLSQTLDSALSQTVEDYEVIAVNDGSTDQSLEILRQYEKKDARIRVIDKENSGVSDSRNRGIAEARGDYLCFLDADDVLAQNYLEAMLDVVSAHSADYVVCQYKAFRQEPCFAPDQSEQAKVRYISSSADLLSIGLMTSVWTKLIKKELITENAILFNPEMTYGEDLFFCWKCFCVAESAWMTDRILYGYRLSGDSAINRFHPNLYEKYKAAFEDLKCFFRTNAETRALEEYNNIDLFFVRRLPSFLRMTIRDRTSFAEKKKRIRYILDDTIFQKVFSEQWGMLTAGMTKKEQKLFRLARDGNTAQLLLQAYGTEFITFLGNLKGKTKTMICLLMMRDMR